MSITQAEHIYLPCSLAQFKQTDVTTNLDGGFCIVGEIVSEQKDRRCLFCGHQTHINGHSVITLKHLPFGRQQTKLKVTRKQYLCPNCNKTFEDPIPFKAHGHYITKQLETFICSLLKTGKLTLRCIAHLAGVHELIVRKIDKQRLEQTYLETDINGKKRFKAPTHPVKYLGIDEFSLHRPFKYATHITDLETGEVLYVAHGKKKQVVYDFIDTVGTEFMKQVKAIACDMNSDFEEAFLARCPHLTIVYDHFHIVKNLNDKVINKIRQDVYYELCHKHQWEEAALLRRSRYILLTSRPNLSDEKISQLDQLLASNKLLFAADIIKEKIRYAFSLTNTTAMEEIINEAIELCKETHNAHFESFAKLLTRHITGIVAHAMYPISTGRIEGINNRIKTMRRSSYGFRDDEYFFLKIIDTSHKEV